MATATLERPRIVDTAPEAPVNHPITILPPKAEGESGSFRKQLEDRQDEYRTLLPGHIPPERFMTVAQTAVKKNPKLLECTPRSLFLALSQAAQDGLMPDGRDGIIQGYNTKVEERGKPDRWENQATWIPMTFGIRKRARETDKIIIDAQIVCANDVFDRDQGDDPKITHKPAPLDQEPGDMIGSYAIFKYEDGNIIHRETMRKSDIEAVRAKSKSPNGMLWKDFPGEAWRKTAIRRGSKTVPVSPDLERIINRDDQHFEFDRSAEVATTLTPPPAPPPVPLASNDTKPVGTELDDVPADEVAELIDGYIEGGKSVTTLKALDELDDEVCATLDTANRDDQRALWNVFYKGRKTELAKA